MQSLIASSRTGIRLLFRSFGWPGWPATLWRAQRPHHARVRGTRRAFSAPAHPPRAPHSPITVYPPLCCLSVCVQPHCSRTSLSSTCRVRAKINGSTGVLHRGCRRVLRKASQSLSETSLTERCSRAACLSSTGGGAPHRSLPSGPADATHRARHHRRVPALCCHRCVHASCSPVPLPSPPCSRCCAITMEATTSTGGLEFVAELLPEVPPTERHSSPPAHSRSALASPPQTLLPHRFRHRCSPTSSNSLLRLLLAHTRS